ncbi:Pre-mRNA-splicing factor 18 [Trichinella pseudospiralis]|uniref:Pre-mRNA-splicing factor 18 n=1 Tax=Trichinella pseudospiralis TaxID=6337 RepID=A0A0V1J109_TRIPS|nr:Pre-mRNA-splicing factor 18 [Trichinella pseudospiralis]KRZ28552.1 Pre-mRNA-splicing factor 18 [Trichinella pseudospiralis]KRZ35332.1 Pre-mRNA-splicing factor 18 [Trichinella pseudospiralis]
MDSLKAELERKRNFLKTFKEKEPNKKFFRRGEVATKYAELKQDEEESGSIADRKDDSTNDCCEEEDVDFDLSKIAETVDRLRERNEPVRMFGESNADVIKRLSRLENEETETKCSEDFERNQKPYLKDFSRANKSEENLDVYEDDIDMTMSDLMEMSKKLEKGNVQLDCELVHNFFSFIMKKWAMELNSRTDEVKRTANGKRAASTHSQTREYLQPLFRQLKFYSVASDIREHLVNITICLLNRNYIEANNHYMQMAIGNAPWPVGVTASGIHKRPGSEKLYVRNVAHVLNDETQRKYIQGLKRLMSRCQIFYPTDPSRSVEFGGVPL